MFVLSFERIAGENNTAKYHRDFSHCYVPNVKIKDFNALIDGKGFFELPVKNEEKILDMIRNSDYITGNLLHFAYFK